jgi:hypothetical protein
MPNDTPTHAMKTWTFESEHMAWLACLGCLLYMVRSEGLMAIEGMVDAPSQPG